MTTRAELVTTSRGDPRRDHSKRLVALASVAAAASLAACAGAPPPPLLELSPPTPPASTPSADVTAMPDEPEVATRTPPAFGEGMTQEAKIAFAAWLVPTHERIHVEFADKFLSSLDALPTTDPLNRLELATVVEIAVDGATGQLVKVGIVETSGVSRFDLGVLEAIQKAAPFPPAHPIIRSADGNVYVTWTFHRDFMLSCALRDVVPHVLGRR